MRGVVHANVVRAADGDANAADASVADDEVAASRAEDAAGGFAACLSSSRGRLWPATLTTALGGLDIGDDTGDAAIGADAAADAVVCLGAGAVSMASESSCWNVGRQEVMCSRMPLIGST